MEKPELTLGLLLFSSLFSLTARATAPVPTVATAGISEQALDPTPTPSSDLLKENQELRARNRELQDQLEALKSAPAVVEVSPPPVFQSRAGEVPIPTQNRVFVQDAAILQLKNGYFLYKAEKFGEAILELSHFLESYADHPLAGWAQYWAGDAYFLQKEYKQASTEFEKVIRLYDKSPAVPDTLKRLILTKEALKQSSDATRYRQQLLSLFPNSPAASSEYTGQFTKTTPPVRQAVRTTRPAGTSNASAPGRAPSSAGMSWDLPPGDDEDGEVEYDPHRGVH